MTSRYLIGLIGFLMLLAIGGCGGSNEPINEGKDRPSTAKKDKEK
jgi:hypothetical protein